MRKIALSFVFSIFWLSSFAQELGIIGTDTTERPPDGLYKLAVKDQKFFVMPPSGMPFSLGFDTDLSIFSTKNSPVFSGNVTLPEINIVGGGKFGRKNSSLFWGDNALDSLSGVYNVAIGNSSMRYAKTANTGIQHAQGNVSIGAFAMSDTTFRGEYNVAIGYLSQGNAYTNYCTTGIGLRTFSAGRNILYSTAVGADSQKDMLVGPNTSMGAKSMLYGQTGLYNTSVGTSTLYYNLSGYENTAVGHLALHYDSTAGGNTAVGAYALQYTQTTGGVAVGAYSQRNNTSGVNNVSVGYNSLGSNTTGNSNTAVGHLASNAGATASNTVAIGTFALRYNSANNVTAVGALAGNNNSTGLYGAFFGYGAGSSNTSGGNNTAIGTSALAVNTTAGGNTAVGYSSLASSNSVDNTGVGSYALNLLTTGIENTALGVQAMKTATTANGNTGVGAYAGQNNTAGNITAVGAYSLRMNTSGVNNSSFGYNALGSNTTGISNTATGTLSLNTNSTGSYNTANGVYALRYSTGSYNTGFGYGTLNALTTGTKNIAIGYNAGSGITTGSNNVFVGGFVGTGFETSSGNIFISDGNATNRIMVNSSGNVGIGNTNPLSLFSVGFASQFQVTSSGKIVQDATITATGTTGAQTINKPLGCVNIAAAGSSVVVTNSLISTTNIVHPWLQSNDATAKSVVVVLGSGTATFYLNAAATSEVRVCFEVKN